MISLQTTPALCSGPLLVIQSVAFEIYLTSCSAVSRWLSVFLQTVLPQLVTFNQPKGHNQIPTTQYSQTAFKLNLRCIPYFHIVSRKVVFLAVSMFAVCKISHLLHGLKGLKNSSVLFYPIDSLLALSTENI